MKKGLSRVLLFAFAFLLVAAEVVTAEDAKARSSVGVIRFPLWSGGVAPPPGWTYETNHLFSDGYQGWTLSPEQWHYRLPFYAKVVSETQVSMVENTQAVADQEIK